MVVYDDEKKGFLSVRLPDNEMELKKIRDGLEQVLKNDKDEKSRKIHSETLKAVNYKLAKFC